MIRRDDRLPDGSPAWTLISQVEHARISGELAAHSIERLGITNIRANLAEVRREVVEAIYHHDDGWTEWERVPGLDPKLSRPLSFMELSADEAIAIWQRSIDGAASIGPLAAAIVAGHFVRLLQHSGSMLHDARCSAWHRQAIASRDQWITEWIALDPASHTPGLAREALQFLWTFDEVSLWVCLNCPTCDEPMRKTPNPYLAGRGTALQMELSVEPLRAGVATANPWRFDAASIDLAAVGQIVAAASYASSQDVLASARPCRLDWRFSREV